MLLGEGKSSKILSCFDHSKVCFNVNIHVFKFPSTFSLQDEQFLGFGSDEEVKVRSPTRSPTGMFKSQDWMLTFHSLCDGFAMPLLFVPSNLIHPKSHPGLWVQPR